MRLVESTEERSADVERCLSFMHSGILAKTPAISIVDYISYATY